MRITIDFDPTTAGADGLDWRRQLLERHPDATIAADAGPDPFVRHVLDTLDRADRLDAATICERLAPAHPDCYRGWARGELGHHLARRGVVSRLVSVPHGRFGFHLELRNGYCRNDLEAAR